jgi:hypothetical protein
VAVGWRVGGVWVEMCVCVCVGGRRVVGGVAAAGARPWQQLRRGEGKVGAPARASAQLQLAAP